MRLARTPSNKDQRHYTVAWVFNGSPDTIHVALEPIGMEFYLERDKQYKIVGDGRPESTCIIEVVYHGKDNLSIYTSTADRVWVLQDDKVIFSDSNDQPPLLS